MAFLGAFVQGPPSAPPPPDALTTLINNTVNTCGHGCWVQLNAPTQGPQAALASYGYTTANFNISSNDPWPDGGGINVGSVSDAAIMSFSAPAIRQTDGKICAFATSGHAAGAVSMVTCFDTQTAAANINSGGSGGSWTIRVKPARFSGCADSRPAWQPQGTSDCSATPAGPVGWTNTNNNSVPQQMPIACHDYWANQWIPGTHHLITSGYFCGFNGGNTMGGTAWYDDDTPLGTDMGTVHFPTLVNANTGNGFGWQGTFTIFAPDAMNDLNASFYVYEDGGLCRWSNLDSTPPVLTCISVANPDEGLGQSQMIAIPAPSAPNQRRWFFNMVAGASNSNCGFSATGCVDLFEDDGATPDTHYTKITRFALSGTIPTLGQGTLAYDSALNFILSYGGGGTISKIYDPTTGHLDTPVFTFTGSIAATTLTVTGTPSGTLAVGTQIAGAGIGGNTFITAFGSGSGGAGTYTINNSLTVGSETMRASNYTWGTYATSALGTVPPTTTDAGTPVAIQSLEPNYHAIEVEVINPATHQAGVYLYVK